MPRHFWRKGRPTAATVALVVVLLLGALVRARLSYAAEWRAEAARAAGR
jgi:hypothetical protein